ncbi:MAG: DUF2791 family P-loop domain-containing protein [Planctomycetota bacterium]
MTGAEITPSVARHIIQRMGETGQPPERHALAVNIGTDAFLEVLKGEYLEPIREHGRNSSFKLVQAPFGGGKTQFLHCLREVAWDMGFLTALVGISPKECPFDDAEKIYAEVARQIELPPIDIEELPEPGLEIVLRQITLDKIDRHGEATVREWLREELARAPVESRDFRRAVVLFMEAILEKDYEREDLLGAYLRGEPVSNQDVAPLRIRELLDGSNAFRFLRSLVQVLRALDQPGLVLLFDEMDRVMSLPVRRKRAIGDNLRQMIDHCGQSTLPALLWVYAVPPEFMTNVVPEYPALEQRLKGAARFSDVSPLQPIIDLDRLPMSPTDLFEKIGLRLQQLYELGFECQLDPGIQRTNIRALAQELGENQLESGTRRTFVKCLVHLLGDQHRGQERILSEADIRALASRSDQVVPLMQDEEDIF